MVVDCGFKVFERVITNGGTVRGLNAVACGGYSRKQIDDLTALAGQFGARGLAYLALAEDGSYRSSFAKFFSDEGLEELIKRMEGKPGDLLLLVAGEPSVVYESLSRLRLHLGRERGLIDESLLAFCWVVDFPFVAWNVEEERWDPSHHLFTSPMREDIPLLERSPGEARGLQYDMVLNGLEVAGGSIRIHERELQETVFKLIGLDPEVSTQRFGHMLEAFTYGTPPHGGIASGIDRVCRILAGEEHIREVIAFPKNQAARDVMADAPSPADPVQLEELHIRLEIAEEN